MAATAISRWKSFLTNSRNMKAGWLVTAGIVALYVGVIRPNEALRGISNSKATGLAAQDYGPIAFWKDSRILPERGIVAERNVQRNTASFLSVTASPAAEMQGADADADTDRKMVRTSSIDLVVAKPAEAAEKIRTLAERLGGFLVSSQISGLQDATGGSLTIRVPAARFAQAQAEIRGLGLRIENEKIEAQDVTKQYVDQEASLRNLRAEERQYLTILNQAKTVKDTLEVSEKLGEVRGQIDQRQAEFAALSRQVETVAISVTLRAEAEAQVFGLNWRPLYQLKLALREGLDGVANYVSSMTELAFLLPSLLLWFVTFVTGCAVAWRVLRWVGRRWFGWSGVVAQ